MSPQLTQSDAIERAILAPDQAKGRRVTLFGSQSTTAGAGATIIAMATIYDPHLILAIQFRSNTTIDPLRLADVLLSNNAALDAAAALRDTRISGLTGLTVGLPASTAPIRFPINLLVNRPITYYKHFAYNGALAPGIMQCILEIQMMGIR